MYVLYMFTNSFSRAVHNSCEYCAVRVRMCDYKKLKVLTVELFGLENRTHITTRFIYTYIHVFVYMCHVYTFSGSCYATSLCFVS